MFNKHFIRSFLLALGLTFLFTGAIAQSYRILLVPFDKFQFESPVAIEDIAAYNSLDHTDEVYTTYNLAISSFLNAQSDSLTFFLPAASDIEHINRVTPRAYKKEPVTHFGVSIEPLKESGKLDELLSNMQADFILFFTRYKIIGKLITSRVSVAKSGQFISWSNHYLDYELYNAQAELIAGSDRFPITPNNPTSKTYMTEGTLVSDLENASGKLAQDIEYKIQRSKRKGEPVFKNKRK